MTSDLHVKYRPTVFKQVIGQGPAIASLKAVLRENRNHSFILTGPSGTGKTTLGRIIAAKLGCDRGNLLEINAADASGVDDMRSVISSLQYAGFGENPTKVVILDECQMLSKSSWNTMLKPVEEPPEHVYWVFCTTEASKIPDTIRTRCPQYELKPVGAEEIFGLLKYVKEAEGFTTVDDILYLCAEKSGGSPRQALVYLSQVAACPTRKEAAVLIKVAAEEGEAIELCRALVKGTSWAEAMKLVDPIKDQNAESIRLTVTAYLSKVAMGAKADDAAGRACTILQAFSEPYPTQSGIAPLLLSVAKAVLMS